MSEPAIDPGTVRITPREVYDRVLGMEGNVTAVKGLLEQSIALQDQSNKSRDTQLREHSESIGQHSARITSVESDVKQLREERANAAGRKASWPQVVGAVAAIVGGAGALLALVTTLGAVAEALASIPK